jgi:hypothetical protein
MENGTGNAGGLQLTATRVFESFDNLMLPKDACPSFGDTLFGISEMPLYRGTVHETPLAGHFSNSIGV